MMPIFCGDVNSAQIKQRIEERHIKTYATKIDSELHSYRKKGSFGKFKSIKEYVNLICSSGAKSLLTMDVHSMRGLILQAERYLPKNHFYRKRNTSPIEEAFKTVNKDFSKIFNYDLFAKGDNGWGLGELAFELRTIIRVCPYCNAETIYAYRVSKGSHLEFKIIKSAFDHYFPKSRYPFLAISLYNLIPACTRCNTGLKSDRYKDLIIMAHPYVDGESVHNGMKFRFIPKSMKFFARCEGRDIARIFFTERKWGAFPQGVKWEQMFRLGETYAELYCDDVADQILKMTQFPKEYIKDMLHKLKVKGFNKERVEKIIFGTPINPSVINKNRQAKMILDVTETFRGTSNISL